MNLTKEQVYQRVGLPKAYWEIPFTIDTLLKNLDVASREHVEAFLNREGLGLFLYGNNGCGKTTLSCSIIHALIKDRVQCFRGDIHHFSSSYKANDWTISPKYIQPQVVVIDEFGKDIESKIDYLTPNLERLLHYRTANHKATILCSNIGGKQIAVKYGETIESLVNGFLQVVTFPKVDHRIKNKE